MFPYTEEEISAKVAKAAAFYWETRRRQARKQKRSGTQDAGKRGQVTGGKHLDGFAKLVQEIGILISGELCKVQYYSDGTEQMVQMLLPSYMVGLEIAVSMKKTSPYSVYASENSMIYWFPVRYLEQEGYLPESERIFLYQQTVQFLANEDIRKYRKIEILSAKSARGRIEKYLRIQMIRYKSREFDIDFNREQLASYLGLNRSVLSHELKKMENEGILTVRKNHFVIHEET